MARGRNKGASSSIGDEAVRARTGKDWAAWFRVLDRAGAKRMNHKQIVAHLREHYEISPWWQQSVTVAYEQARGLRDVHEKPAGYEIGRSRTIAIPVETAYKAWSQLRTRRRWLQDPEFTVRKSTPNKSMRITWVDGKTDLSTMFWYKGPEKCQVSVQHGKLRSAAAAARMKTYWKRNLDRLKELLES
jgi:hypothetical protein